MKVLKTGSPMEQKIRRVESLLMAEGILITPGQDGLLISVGDDEETFVIRLEGGEVSQEFPNTFAPTCIQTIDDFRYGR